jgi:hypothetical protein
MTRDRSEKLLNSKSSIIGREFKKRPFIRLVITSMAAVLSFLAILSLFGFFTHAEMVSSYYANKTFIDKITTSIVLSGPIGIGIFSGTSILLWISRSRI